MYNILKLNNFRRFKDFSIELKPISLIAGKNNTGTDIEVRGHNSSRRKKYKREREKREAKQSVTGTYSIFCRKRGSIGAKIYS